MVWLPQYDHFLREDRVSNTSKYKSQGHIVVPGKQAKLATSPKQPTADLRNWYAQLKELLGTEALPVFEVKQFGKKKAKAEGYKAIVVVEHGGRRVRVPDIFLTTIG